jgi:hypothetical protein
VPEADFTKCLPLGAFVVDDNFGDTVTEISNVIDVSKISDWRCGVLGNFSPK